MTLDTIILTQKVNFNCKGCGRFLIEFSTFDKPFKPNADGVELSVKCYQCNHLNTINVINGKGEKFIDTIET